MGVIPRNHVLVGGERAMTDMIIVDTLGIHHKVENGAGRNTRCGRLIVGSVGRSGDVDCMACIGGQSLLSLQDLRDGVEVMVWVQLFDSHGNFTGDSVPVTFTNGTNTRAFSFVGLVPGTTLIGHRYHDEDGKTVWVSRWEEPLVLKEGFDIVIDARQAKVG
jgi:hypothetical protein